MDAAILRRRFVALLAAYGLALHALLSGIATVAPGAPPSALGVLCSHDAGGDASGIPMPADQDGACAAICVALGCSVAGPVPPGVTIALAGPLVSAVLTPRGGWVEPSSIAHHPHAPRGPPLA